MLIKIETTTTKTTHGCKTGTKITAKQSFKIPYIGATEFAAEVFAEYN
ncbi:ETX/MTX2 family pore-forming toxin, partial [Escherichia sp. TWPC-MK]